MDVICTKCGRKADRGKYCTFCGAILHEKTLDYENTKTLMRSNIKIDNFPKPEGPRKEPVNNNEIPFVKETLHNPIKEESPKITEDIVSHSQSQTNSDYVEDIQKTESKISFLSENPIISEEPQDNSNIDFDSDNDAQNIEPSPIAEEEISFPEVAESVTEEVQEDVSYDSFADLMNEPEEEIQPQAEETVVPIEEVQVEEIPSPIEETDTPETVESVTEEIQEDISYDSFADLMNEPEEEIQPQNEETVVPIEEVQVEEIPSTIEETDTPETVESVTEEIQEDISYDNFADLMNEPEEIQPQTEETVIPVEDVQVEEDTSSIENLSAETEVSKSVIEEIPEKIEEELVSEEVENVSEDTKETDVTLEKESPEESEAPKPPAPSIPYSDIDPMFGPPPTMNFTAKAPQPQKVEKTGFFKKKIGKKNK